MECYKHLINLQMTSPKITYAPDTVFIVRYDSPMERVLAYVKTGIMPMKKNLIVVKNGRHGNAQDEFKMSDCCAKHKEMILAILN